MTFGSLQQKLLHRNEKGISDDDETTPTNDITINVLWSYKYLHLGKSCTNREISMKVSDTNLNIFKANTIFKLVN